MKSRSVRTSCRDALQISVWIRIPCRSIFLLQSTLSLFCCLAIVFSPSLLNASESVHSYKFSNSLSASRVQSGRSISWDSTHLPVGVHSTMHSEWRGGLRKPRNEPKISPRNTHALFPLRGGSSSTLQPGGSCKPAAPSSPIDPTKPVDSGLAAAAPSPSGIWQSFKRLRRGIISTSIEKASLDTFGQPGIFRVSQPSVRFSVICPGTSFGNHSHSPPASQSR